MKISIEADALSDVLVIALRVVEQKSSTIPIMGNVLLRAEGRHLLVAASNISATLSCELKCDINQPGAVTLSAKIFADIVKSFSGTLAIESKDDGAEIRCGKARVKVAGLPARDFPKLPDHREQKFFTLDPTLIQMIVACEYAASTDINRTMLHGIYLESHDGKASVMSSDGHQGWMGMQLAVTPPIAGILLPRRIAADLKALGTAELAIGKAHVFVRSGPKVLALALPEGKFPPLDQLIPKQQPIRPVVPREALIKIVKRAALMSPQTIRINLQDGIFRVASFKGSGEAEDEVSVSYDGSDFECGCNPGYLINALNAFESDEVVLGFSPHYLKDNAPITLRAATDNGITAFVMPMAL